MSQFLAITLKSHRKRSGFSQDEMAVLLGLKMASAVSRYERGERSPDLDTAFACQIVLGSGLEQLFPGAYGEIRQLVSSRATQLAEQLRRGAQDNKARYKLAKLEALARASV